jgi:hypothetical protein
MKRSQARMILVASIILVVGLAAYGYRLYRNAAQANEAIGRAVAEIVRHPREAAAVSGDAWRQVRTGMSKAEVVALLGDAPGQARYEPAGAAGPEPAQPSERWEYGWVSAFGAPIPDSRAYVVWFGPDAKVSSLRGPTQDQPAGHVRDKRGQPEE